MLTVVEVAACENSEVNGEDHGQEHEDHEREVENISYIELEVLLNDPYYERHDNKCR